MSFRSEASSPSYALHGAEGDLVFVRVSIEPRLLENLLDALAGLEFPINPQIYHNAAADRATIVEFPAWARRLPEIRDALRGRGLDEAVIGVRNMLEDIQSGPMRPRTARASS